MSSHHVVRENQEPALLFVQSNSCNKDVLNALLEWSPYVMAFTEGLDYLLANGIKIDALMGNESELEKFTPLDFQSHIELIRQENQYSIAEALQWLENKKHQGVNIIASFDIDLTRHIDNSTLAVNVIDDNMKWSYVKSGRLRKWWPKDTVLEVKGLKEVKIKNENEKQLTNEATHPLQESGKVTFYSEKPFWLGEFVA